MKILIDLQGAQTGSRFRGIGRYSMSLTKGILRNAGDHEIIIALSDLLPESIESIREELSPLISQDSIFIWEGVGPTSEIHKENQWRRGASELIRESFFQSLKPDIILVTSLIEGYDDDFAASIHSLDQSIPVAAIFYDLIPLIYKETYLVDPKHIAWYENRLSHLKRADLFLAISQASMEEAIDTFKINPQNIANISSASDEKFHLISSSSSDKKLSNRLGVSKSFLLYTSATDSRKNHLRLIEAFARLDSNIRKNHQLVFAGRLPGDHLAQFEKYAYEQGLTPGELIITGELTDHEMNILYNTCKAFVFPSWHEGFGLPILEAMHCGRAVIGSNRSSIPEVIGNEEALFDPFDVLSIHNKLRQVLLDDAFRNKLENHAKQQIQKFTWDLSAKRALIAIESFMANQENKVNLRKEVHESPDEKEHDLVLALAKIPFAHRNVDLLKTAQAVAQNSRKESTKKLFVDISVLVQVDAKTGIQRVVRNILREWLMNPPAGWRVEPIYGFRDTPYRYAQQFTSRFLGKDSLGLIDEVIEFSAGDAYIGLDLLHSNIAEAHENFYQKMRRYGVKVKFVVYDLLPLKFPQFADKSVPEGYLQWLKIILKSDGAICISNSVADELKEWIKVNSYKVPNSFAISWFHLGADQEVNVLNSLPISDADHNLLDAIRQKQTFLSVATLEPRKGHRQILDAFNILWESGHDLNLVFVGKPGWNVDLLVEEILDHPEYQKRFFWLNGVSDQFLEEVYEASSCLIAASEGEGFGLPLIEAAQHNKPIIARDIPVFREVASKYAFYFDSLEPIGLTNAITKWLELYKNAQHPQSNEMPRISWAQSGEQLLSSYGLLAHAKIGI